MATKYTLARRDGQDWHVKALADLKIHIKAYILRNLLAKKDRGKIMERLYKEIETFISEFTEEEQTTAKAYRQELLAFADEAYTMTDKAVGNKTAYLFALSLENPETLTTHQKAEIVKRSGQMTFSLTDQQMQTVADIDAETPLEDWAYNMATPAETFYDDIHNQAQEYMKDYAQLTEPRHYVANVNPRNIAEMSVRFEHYRQEKHRLINEGVRLVYVPAHSNCSKRCQPYQGKVYSLDGTSGSVDGRSFVPIEDVAEGVTYTSQRTGRTYPAGLFSYNCRHTMKVYQDGQNIEQIPDEVIERRRDIEEHQRAMERQIRALKEKVFLYQQIYQQAPTDGVRETIEETLAEIKRLTDGYKDYSRQNHMPFLPKRIEIFDGENIYQRTVGRKDPVIKRTKI